MATFANSTQTAQPTTADNKLPDAPNQAEVNQQYLDFVNTFRPPTTTSETTPASFQESINPISMVGGIAGDAFNTLIVNPATRIAEAGTSLAEPLMSPEMRANVEANLQKPQTTLGQTVASQKTGIAGAKQIAGQALKAGSYLAGGELAPEIGEGANTAQKIMSGVSVGLPLGAAAGAGNELQNNPDATAGSTLNAAVTGGVEGAAVGGVAAPVVGAAVESFHPTDAQVNAQALKDVTPTSEDVLSGQAPRGVGEDNQARLSEGKGLFGKRSVMQNQLEQDSAAELQKIPAYRAAVNGTNLDRFNATTQPLNDLNVQLKTQLAKENFMQTGDSLYNKMLDAVDAEAKQNPALSDKGQTYGSIKVNGKDINTADYTDAKMNDYLRVLKATIKNIFNKGANGDEGSLADELEVKQKMDNYHKNSTGGKKFQSQSDSPTKTLSIMNGTTRDAMTEDIASNAKNTQVKPILKQEWDLLRAREQLWSKAGDEQSSRMGRFIQNVPRPVRYLGRRAFIGPAVTAIGLSTAASAASKALKGK